MLQNFFEVDCDLKNGCFGKQGRKKWLQNKNAYHIYQTTRYAFLENDTSLLFNKFVLF